MTGPLERLVERCLCGGCPRCGHHEPINQDERDADLEDRAARRIDAEADTCA